MKDSLRQQFERLAMRLTELDARLADPQIGADIKRYRALAREQAEANSLVALFQRYQVRERDLCHRPRDAARRQRRRDDCNGTRGSRRCRGRPPSPACRVADRAAAA